jgi:DeoR family fructose operon transcriptional repressor
MASLNRDSHMLSYDRQQMIAQIVSQKRSATIEELSEMFPVSSVTIRRDLDRLARDGKVTRVHGGAVVPADIVVAPKSSDQMLHLTEEKLRIGKEAVKRIRDDQFLIIESGSTCLALVKSLQERRNLKILTASPMIVMALAELNDTFNCGFEIMSCGGSLNVYKNFLLGPHARELFEKTRVDIAFVSVTAIDLEAGITADSHAEAEITKTILERSAKTRIGLITSAKFNKTSFIRVSDAEILDEIITDDEIDPTTVSRYSKKGIRVTVCARPTEGEPA